MRDPIGQVPDGYAVHRIGATWLVLDREISDRRIFPAINLNRSSTRKEELLLSETELNRVYLLRNFLADMPATEAIEFLLARMSGTETNQEFLDSMTRGE